MCSSTSSPSTYGRDRGQDAAFADRGSGRKRWSAVNRPRTSARATTTVVVAPDANTRNITTALHEYRLHGEDTGEDQAGHRAGQEHQSGGLGALDLRRQRGAQRVRKVCRVSGGCPPAARRPGGVPPAPSPSSSCRPSFRRWARVCVLQRKDLAAVQRPEGDFRGGAERGDRQRHDAPALRRPSPRDVSGVGDDGRNPQPGLQHRPARFDHQCHGGPHQQKLD
jgi:hypothetical protein